MDINDAAYSTTKAVEELVLLSDHLQNPEQQCPACILKHAMKARAYASEATSLANAGPGTAAIAVAVERIVGELDNEDPSTWQPVAHLIRELRYALQLRGGVVSLGDQHAT